MDEFLVSPFWLLVSQLALLSMMAIGGGVVVVAPEIHRYVVETHQWISSEDFAAAFSLAQAAPGPNFLYVTVLGWKIAGLAGAVGATLAVIVPPSIFTVVIMKLTGGQTVGPRGIAIRNGIAPISVGLLLATSWLLARTADTTVNAALLTIATVAVMLFTRLNPVWLIVAGAAAGLLGFV